MFSEKNILQLKLKHISRKCLWVLHKLFSTKLIISIKKRKWFLKVFKTNLNKMKIVLKMTFNFTLIFISVGAQKYRSYSFFCQIESFLDFRQLHMCLIISQKKANKFKFIFHNKIYLLWYSKKVDLVIYTFLEF